MEKLVVCRGCQRHVFVRESRCPFCATPLVAGVRLRRARAPMMMTVAVATAATLGACGGSTASDSTKPDAADAQTDVADAGSDTRIDSATLDSGVDTAEADVVPVPIYGSPPPTPKD